MSDGFDAGSKGAKAKKDGGGLWSSLRSVGAGLVEGFLGQSTVPGSPGHGPRDPVAARDRPAAAKQIHRSLKAWREREPDHATSAEPAADINPKGADAEASQEDPGESGEGNAATASDSQAGADGPDSEEKAEASDAASETPVDEAPPEVATKPLSAAAKLKRKIHRSPQSGSKIFRAGGGKPVDPRRAPVIKTNAADKSVTANDPASDGGTSIVGTCTWNGGVVTLAVYPKDSMISGAKATDANRMRGGVIFDAMIAAMNCVLGELMKEYLDLFKSPGDEADIRKTFSIKGINGVWGGDSDNLVTFNTEYKSGKSLEESAKKTFTGIQAKQKLGFEKVTMKATDPDVLKKPQLVPAARASGFTKVHCLFDQ